MAKHKIGILGTGDVGRVLGAGFLAAGHEALIGSREPNSDKLKEWVKKTEGKGKTGSFADAAKFGDVVVLACLGTAVEDVIKSAGGADAFAGKVVLDATNPLQFSPTAPPSLFVGGNDSLGERVQRWLPKAKVVKAFNTVGNAHMVNPSFPGGDPDFFHAGGDGAAKATVRELAKDLGWKSFVDLGDITASRALEEMCIAWVRHGIVSGSWGHAFKMLRK